MTQETQKHHNNLNSFKSVNEEQRQQAMINWSREELALNEMVDEPESEDPTSDIVHWYNTHSDIIRKVLTKNISDAKNEHIKNLEKEIQSLHNTIRDLESQLDKANKISFAHFTHS